MNITQMSTVTKIDPICLIVFNPNSTVSLFLHNNLKSNDGVFLQGHVKKGFKNIRTLEETRSLSGGVNISSQVPT